MSQIVVSAIGQEDVIQPQALVSIPEDVYGGLQRVWNNARQRCLKVFTPEQCRAVFGSRPVFLEDEEEDGLEWYIWLGIGILIGKVIL